MVLAYLICASRNIVTESGMHCDEKLKPHHTCQVQGSQTSVNNDSGLLGCDAELPGGWFMTFPSTVSFSSSRYIETLRGRLISSS
jgi:hypothetical protein